MNAVLASIPSDSHTWNLVYLQLLLEERGNSVRNLGCCTTAEEIVEACCGLAAELLVISSLNGHAVIETPALLEKVRAQCDPRLRIAIGGQLTCHAATERMAAETLRASGCDAVFTGPDAVERFVGWLDTLDGIELDGEAWR